VATLRNCDRCKEPLRPKEIRTIICAGARIYLCKTCFLKLPQKDRADSERETELLHQVNYAQEELPF